MEDYNQSMHNKNCFHFQILIDDIRISVGISLFCNVIPTLRNYELLYICFLQTKNKYFIDREWIKYGDFRRCDFSFVIDRLNILQCFMLDRLVS